MPTITFVIVKNCNQLQLYLSNSLFKNIFSSNYRDQWMLFTKIEKYSSHSLYRASLHSSFGYIAHFLLPLRENE